MLNTVKTIVIASAIIAPMSLLAQDQTAETAQATDLVQGEPVAPEVTSEVFGDWTVNCQEVNERENCQMTQLLLNTDGSPAIEIALFPVAGQTEVFAGGTVVAPLGTLLTSQLTISVDGALGKRYPFSYCLPEGCVSRVGLTEEDVNTYKRGAEASVSLGSVSAPDQVFGFNMSLAGFTAAFDRMPR